MPYEDSNEEITCPAGHNGPWNYIETAIVGVYEVEVIGNKIIIDATEGNTCFEADETERDGFLECCASSDGQMCRGVISISDEFFEIERIEVTGGVPALIKLAQIEIVALACVGISTPDIAIRVGATLPSVRRLIRTIYKQNELHSRLDLFSWAHRTGLITVTWKDGSQ